MTPGPDWIDHERSACLCDVGCADYIAATVVSPDGEPRLILACRDEVGTDATYRIDCPDAPHEQTGPLPTEYTNRIERKPQR